MFVVPRFREKGFMQPSSTAVMIIVSVEAEGSINRKAIYVVGEVSNMKRDAGGRCRVAGEGGDGEVEEE